MRLRQWFCAMACATAVFCVTGRTADAAAITSINQFLLPGFSTGSLGHSLPVAPNNDDTAAASPNTISTGGFGIFLNSGGFGVLDYEFNLTDSGGTTEYLFTTNVINNTGVAWTGFRFLLGFGTGADFVPVGAGVGLDFDAPTAGPAPTSTAFPLLNHQSTRIDWSGATVNYLLGPGGAPFSSVFSLSIDVPDGLAAYHPGGVNRFTLRSLPTADAVPEPVSVALVSLGLAAVVSRRRVRR
jgi:hypothetical protein